MNEPRPLTLQDFGYAPGNYSCMCHSCGEEFIGDKRAIQCEGCATMKLRRSVAQPAADTIAKPQGFPTSNLVSRLRDLSNRLRDSGHYAADECDLAGASLIDDAIAALTVETPSPLVQVIDALTGELEAVRELLGRIVTADDGAMEEMLKLGFEPSAKARALTDEARKFISRPALKTSAPHSFDTNGSDV